ncbi:hypothetical protein, partial [uncultured Oscillibacter sp.]|uniref:hypothetical protein n=1 Tax=uncultured Oscillibacter sp. TaxID=876091 RepID=UPI0026314642
SGPPSLRLLFWRKQILDPIPLFFADFMSFHVLYFIISALYTQSLSFKTDSMACLKIVNTPKRRLFFRFSNSA